MEGFPAYYEAVFQHIETLRFQVAERACVVLKGPVAGRAIDAALLPDSLDSQRHKPAIPLPFDAVEYLEDKRAQETEGLAFSLGFPLLRDPKERMLHPVINIPLDTQHDGQGNLRATRRLVPPRLNGEFLGMAGAQAPSIGREVPERPVIETLLGALDLEALAEETGLKAIPNAAAFYSFTDADYLFNLRLDYEDLESSEESCLSALLDGRRPRLKGKLPRGATLGGVELTPSQAEAVEAIYRNRITPIEGPPGTGKTTLITNLCARTVVERALSKSRRAFANTLLVTSTNNKAVRNVAEAFEGLEPGVFLTGRREVVAESMEKLGALLSRMGDEQEAAERAAELRERMRSAEGDDLFNAAREFLYRRFEAEPDRRKPLERAVKIYLQAREKKRWRRLSTLLESAGALEAFYDLFPVVVCTTLSIRNVLPAGLVTDLAIVDEASQTLLPYSLPVAARARRMAVIGDENQLQPIVDLPTETLTGIETRTLGEAAPERMRYNRSLLSAVWDDTCHSLREHFRCRKAIISFCDRICDYGLEVRTPERGLGTELGLDGTLFDMPVLFLDVPSEHTRAGGSYRNEAEAGAAVEYVRRLWWKSASRVVGRDLRDLAAVITPYRAQAWLIRSVLRKDPELREFMRRPSMTVGTVHALQGDEKPVVVLSMTIGQGEGGFAFVNMGRNLLNVAVSRARQQLVVVGDSRRLSVEPGPWVRALWEHVQMLMEEGLARRITIQELADPTYWSSRV